MGVSHSYPTPYADVNAIVDELHANVRVILKDQFVGLYLHGSLALRDFTYGRSDIDFLVVTEGELSSDHISALRAMHARLASEAPPWGAELEGLYIPRDALLRYDPTRALHPKIERGENLVVEQHASDMVIQRYVLREHGLVVSGPLPEVLIDPIHSPEMRDALVTLLRDWWAPMIVDPVRLHQRGYQAYTALTMCRVLHTLDSGTIVPKAVAARWVQEQYGERWDALIERALQWRHDGHAIDRTPVSDTEVDETRDLIRFACERGKGFR